MLDYRNALKTKTDLAKLFWICVGAHLLFWTVIPALTTPNALTDVIEGYVWGREWPLGTHKHPPLHAWILQILAVLTGRSSWTPFLASQLSVTAAFWAVWQTGRRIVGEAGAVLAALLLVGVTYFNVITPEFNPNVLQIGFWALMGQSFHRAIKEDRDADWLLLGLWGAAGLYTKYSSALMIVTLGFLMLAHPEARKRFAGRGPWLALLTLLLLFLPHLIWLLDHRFVPLTYTESRFERLSSHTGFIIAPILFVLWQMAACLPAILIYVLAFGPGKKLSRVLSRSFDGMFLSCVTFGPFLLTLVIAAVFGVKIRNMWGAPFWNFLGLWAIFYFQPKFSLGALKRYACLWGFVFIAGLLAVAGKNILEPYKTHKAGRIYFPGRALAEEISAEWQQRMHTPLRYVIGDIWVAGNIAWYAPGQTDQRPHVLINGDYSISPGVTPEDIRKYGGVIVWCRGDCTHQDNEDVPGWYWTEFSQEAKMQPVLAIPQQTGAPVNPTRIGWAILAPEAP